MVHRPSGVFFVFLSFFFEIKDTGFFTFFAIAGKRVVGIIVIVIAHQALYDDVFTAIRTIVIDIKKHSDIVASVKSRIENLSGQFFHNFASFFDILTRKRQKINTKR